MRLSAAACQWKRQPRPNRAWILQQMIALLGFQVLILAMWFPCLVLICAFVSGSSYLISKFFPRTVLFVALALLAVPVLSFFLTDNGLRYFPISLQRFLSSPFAFLGTIVLFFTCGLAALSGWMIRGNKANPKRSKLKS
jgi:hypothetical protein